MMLQRMLIIQILLLSFCLITQQLRFPYIHPSQSSILLPVSSERSSSSSCPAETGKREDEVNVDIAVGGMGLRRERVPLRSRLLSATSLCVGIFGLSVNAFASVDSAWTDRNRLAAETWRAVDEIYLDRTFNGQDWFKLRQEVVKRDYRSDEELYSSIKSMVSKLGDRYTRYLNPAQYSALLNSATGELIGLGAELIADDVGGTVIARMEDASPAKEAGLMQGDKILNVDGVDTSNSSPEEVAAVMRGKLDSKVGIRISRSGVIEDKSAIRKQIKLKSVSYSFVDLPPVGSAAASRRVGYIKLRSFSSTSRDDVTQALEYLHSEDSSRQHPLDALVVDLRDNGGGLLQGAVETSNLLLPPGKIVVFVVSKDGSTDALQTLPNGVLSADPALPDLRTPCFILVNSNTASAAEVFAAAMKENARARLVGEKTFGKGIIQNLQPLRQWGVAITTARYETPLHHDINKLGTY